IDAFTHVSPPPTTYFVAPNQMVVFELLPKTPFCDAHRQYHVPDVHCPVAVLLYAVHAPSVRSVTARFPAPDPRSLFDLPTDYTPMDRAAVSEKRIAIITE